MKELVCSILAIFLTIPRSIFTQETDPPISFCQGPNNFLANSPLHPFKNKGNWIITLAGFYWNTHQDGMEFAIETGIETPIINATEEEILELNTLIESKIYTPLGHWEFGYKLGLGYQTPCDGWDIHVLWTHFRNRLFTQLQTEREDAHTLLALWSAFYPAQGSIVFAREISATWKVKIDLVDIDLGREFWNGKQLSLRPFLGFRHGRIDQDLDLQHKGGSWSPRVTPTQDPFTNKVFLDNTYKGFGIRTGIDTNWYTGCGFGIFGNFATSILYGHFNIAHDEKNMLSMFPYTQTDVLATKSHYRASRAILDLIFGVEWAARFEFCEIHTKIGWEHHLFFHQNQFWRVNRISNLQSPLPNNNGQNVFSQKRGTLSTQGWTLTFLLGF